MTRYPLHHALLPALLAIVTPVLAEDEKTLSAITITAEADSVEERRNAASQKTVVGRKELDDLGALTVGEVLGKLPGIDATAGGDGSMAMRARGMVRDSVQILVDGERLSANARMALTMISRLPSSELARVEIVRGASAEFGGGAPVTINLVMRKALPKDSLSLKLAAGVREDEPNGQFNIVRGGGEDGFSWLLPLTVFHHGSLTDKETVRRQYSDGVPTLRQVDRDHGEAPIPGLSFAPRLAWKRGADSFTLSPMLVYTEADRSRTMTRYSYADPAALTDYAADGGRRDREEGDSRQLRLRAEAEKLLGDSKLTARLAVMHGGRSTDTVRDSYDAAGISTLSHETLRRREDELNAALRLDHALGAHLIAASVELNGHRRRDAHTLDTSTIYRAEDRQFTAWLQDEWSPAGNLTVTGGLRGETARLEADARARDHSRLLPSLALRWEPREGWVLRSSLGAGLKLPKLDELTGLPVASLGANTPLEADQRGNPDLRPERSVNFEAVLERYLPGNAGVFGANLYWRATRDFVERRVALEGDRWVERPYNEGDARHWGLELDAKLRTDAWGPKGGALRAHLTLPHGEVEDRRLGVTRDARETPRYQLTLGYDHSLPAWKASAGFQVQRYGRARSGLPGEQWAEVAPRTLLDVYVTRRLTPALNLRLNIQNLLEADTVRRADAWSGGDAWSLDASDRGKRNVLLSLEGKW